MINISQARELIIKPALVAISKWSPAAENLLIGTMLIESHGGSYIKQHPTGPAIGPYQHEPVTLNDDIRWLNYGQNRTLKLSCLSACYYEIFPPCDALMYNWRYATIMARIHYFRAAPPLPHEDDIKGLGQYWKDHWNTANGKGRVDNYVQLYKNHHQR